MVDLAHVAPMLAKAGAWEAVVSLTAAKAKTVDPQSTAMQPTDTGRKAAKVSVCSAYPAHPNMPARRVLMSTHVSSHTL